MTTILAEPTPAVGRLQRSVGVWFGVAVGVGSMIGAGILRAPAQVAAQLPSPGLVLAAWLIGGAYALLGANAIAELACIAPRSGGQYVFVRRALVGGLLATIALYVLLNVAFLIVLPLDAMAASPLAASSAAAVVFGANGGLLVQLLIALALPSALVANTLCASRVGLVLGQDGLAPASFGRVNAGGTPSIALVASSLIGALLLLSGTFERIIAICAFLFVASYAMSFLSVFVLRRREPTTPRPYRAWGHPWTTGIVLLGSLVFLGSTLVADPGGAAIVGVLLVLSYPACRLLSRRRA